MIAAFYENIVSGSEASKISVTDAVSNLMDHGLEALYILDNSLKYRADEVHAVLKATGIAVAGLHAWIDFSSDPSNQSFRFLIDEAVRLKTDNVLIVPGMESAKNIVHGMQKAVYYGDAMNIRVCMEPLDRLDAPYCTLEGLEYFLSNIPGLYCCFDTGNLVLHAEDEVEAFRQLSDKVCAMHLKDRSRQSRYSDTIAKICANGDIVYPAPVGSGFIRIGEILDMAEDMPLIVELYDYSLEHMLDGLRESLDWVSNRL